MKKKTENFENFSASLRIGIGIGECFPLHEQETISSDLQRLSSFCISFYTRPHAFHATGLKLSVLKTTE